MEIERENLDGADAKRIGGQGNGDFNGGERIHGTMKRERAFMNNNTIYGSVDNVRLRDGYEYKRNWLNLGDVKALIDSAGENNEIGLIAYTPDQIPDNAYLYDANSPESAQEFLNIIPNGTSGKGELGVVDNSGHALPQRDLRTSFAGGVVTAAGAAAAAAGARILASPTARSVVNNSTVSINSHIIDGITLGAQSAAASCAASPLALGLVIGGVVVIAVGAYIAYRSFRKS